MRRIWRMAKPLPASDSSSSGSSSKPDSHWQMLYNQFGIINLNTRRVWHLCLPKMQTRPQPDWFHISGQQKQSEGESEFGRKRQQRNALVKNQAKTNRLIEQLANYRINRCPFSITSRAGRRLTESGDHFSDFFCFNSHTVLLYLLVWFIYWSVNCFSLTGKFSKIGWLLKAAFKYFYFWHSPRLHYDRFHICQLSYLPCTFLSILATVSS